MPREIDRPTTAQEARYRMRVLVSDMTTIENQLSNRNKLDHNGERMEVHVYWEWNARAKYALSKKREEHRFLKDWLKENGDTEKILADTLFTMLDLPDTATDQEIALCCRSSGYFRKLYVERFGEVP